MVDKNPKNIIHVEITDSVGDGGTFYGDHVVVGDPFEDPPANWEHGQLLFDGNEEDPWGGDGDGGGPHGHSQYALVEHDHDEFTHDHDYLPLEGGTLAGDLRVDGVTAISSGTAAAPGLSFADSAWSGFYYDAVTIHTSVQGVSRLQVGTAGTKVTGDLQVDGRIQAFTGVSPADPAIKFDAGTGMYRKGTHQIGFAINGVLVASIDSGGVQGRIAFNVAADIDTADVLDRAETATMPAVDDESVATTDAEVDSLTVNEVMTAMLAKIKELSARIEELESN